MLNVGCEGDIECVFVTYDTSRGVSGGMADGVGGPGPASHLTTREKVHLLKHRQSGPIHTTYASGCSAVSRSWGTVRGIQTPSLVRHCRGRISMSSSIDSIPCPRPWCSRTFACEYKHLDNTLS